MLYSDTLYDLFLVLPTLLDVLFFSFCFEVVLVSGLRTQENKEFSQENSEDPCPITTYDII